MLNISDPNQVTQYRTAISHLGFRPFFLGGLAISIILMVLWMGLYRAYWTLPLSGLPITIWHGHEMIYGYSTAIVTGFLLTAIRNWTGVQTIHKWPLLVLAGCWLVARLIPILNLPIELMALFDLLFNLAAVVAMTIPIVKARQWQQISILVKVALIGVGNLLFYLGYEQWGLYIGLYMVISLIMVVGRRVIPFFIEKGVGYQVELRNSKWLDLSSLVLFFSFVVVDVFFPEMAVVISALALGLTVVHVIRLWGWWTYGILKRPLLWVLYLGYMFIIAGFVIKALIPFTALSPYFALHTFAIGGVALISVGMLARVSLGHTGRDVFSPFINLTPIFLLLAASAIVRVFLPMISPPAMYPMWVMISQLLWIVTFVSMLWFYAPILIKPRVDGQYG